MKSSVIGDIFLIILSLVAAYFLAKTNFVANFLLATQGVKLVGIFLAGFFFTSIFTIAPAMVMIAELAIYNSLWTLAIVGGIGAVVGDYLIFLLIRDQITARVIKFFGKTELKKIVVKDLLKFKPVRWLAFLIGALIIASPLPDEFGLALIGISKIKLRYFFLTSFISNVIGILAVAGVAISFT